MKNILRLNLMLAFLIYIPRSFSAEHSGAGGGGAGKEETAKEITVNIYNLTGQGPTFSVDPKKTTLGDLKNEVMKFFKLPNTDCVRLIFKGKDITFQGDDTKLSNIEVIHESANCDFIRISFVLKLQDSRPATSSGGNK